MIIDENNNPLAPDDSLYGGTIVLTFNASVVPTVHAVRVIDIQASGATIKTFATVASTTPIATYAIAPMANNAIRTVALGGEAIRRMEIKLTELGAVLFIDARVANPCPTTPPTTTTAPPPTTVTVTPFPACNNTWIRPPFTGFATVMGSNILAGGSLSAPSTALVTSQAKGFGVVGATITRQDTDAQLGFSTQWGISEVLTYNFTAPMMYMQVYVQDLYNPKDTKRDEAVRWTTWRFGHRMTTADVFALAGASEVYVVIAPPHPFDAVTFEAVPTQEQKSDQNTAFFVLSKWLRRWCPGNATVCDMCYNDNPDRVVCLPSTVYPASRVSHTIHCDHWPLYRDVFGASCGNCTSGWVRHHDHNDHHGDHHHGDSDDDRNDDDGDEPPGTRRRNLLQLPPPAYANANATLSFAPYTSAAPSGRITVAGVCASPNATASVVSGTAGVVGVQGSGVGDVVTVATNGAIALPWEITVVLQVCKTVVLSVGAPGPGGICSVTLPPWTGVMPLPLVVPYAANCGGGYSLVSCNLTVAPLPGEPIFQFPNGTTCASLVGVALTSTTGNGILVSGLAGNSTLVVADSVITKVEAGYAGALASLYISGSSLNTTAVVTGASLASGVFIQSNITCSGPCFPNGTAVDGLAQVGGSVTVAGPIAVVPVGAWDCNPSRTAIANLTANATACGFPQGNPPSQGNATAPTPSAFVTSTSTTAALFEAGVDAVTLYPGCVVATRADVIRGNVTTLVATGATVTSVSGSLVFGTVGSMAIVNSTFPRIGRSLVRGTVGSLDIIGSSVTTLNVLATSVLTDVDLVGSTVRCTAVTLGFVRTLTIDHATLIGTTCYNVSRVGSFVANTATVSCTAGPLQ